MIYLDSNVFIYATLSRKRKGERCRELLGEVKDGKNPASTSTLTFDEVVWKVSKERDLEQAILAGETLLEMPNLLLIEVNAEVLWESLRLIKQYKLNPRDAIHAACSLIHGVFTIVSEDPDFDKIKEVERRGV